MPARTVHPGQDVGPIGSRSQRSLSVVPLTVAERARCRDVVRAIVPAILAGDQVFGGALEPPHGALAQPLLGGEAGRVVGPHGVVAIDAASVLTLKSQSSGAVELGHSRLAG